MTIRKILLVDDDSVCNYLTQEIILNLKLAEGIAVATNGEEALRFFQNGEEFKYDLILLDLNMPVMNGFEFLDQVKASYQNLRQKTKIVVLTTSANGEDMEKLRSRSIDGFIIKPLSKESLLESIKML